MILAAKAGELPGLRPPRAVLVSFPVTAVFGGLSKGDVLFVMISNNVNIEGVSFSSVNVGRPLATAGNALPGLAAVVKRPPSHIPSGSCGNGADTCASQINCPRTLELILAAWCRVNLHHGLGVRSPCDFAGAKKKKKNSFNAQKEEEIEGIINARTRASIKEVVIKSTPQGGRDGRGDPIDVVAFTKGKDSGKGKGPCQML